MDVLHSHRHCASDHRAVRTVRSACRRFALRLSDWSRLGTFTMCPFGTVRLTTQCSHHQPAFPFQFRLRAFGHVPSHPFLLHVLGTPRSHSQCLSTMCTLGLLAASIVFAPFQSHAHKSSASMRDGRCDPGVQPCDCSLLRHLDRSPSRRSKRRRPYARFGLSDVLGMASKRRRTVKRTRNRPLPFILVTGTCMSRTWLKISSTPITGRSLPVFASRPSRSERIESGIEVLSYAMFFFSLQGFASRRSAIVAPLGEGPDPARPKHRRGGYLVWDVDLKSRSPSRPGAACSLLHCTALHGTATATCRLRE